MILTDLSIIIPNYNHSHYLNKCFSNLSKLEVMPREIVIIDDCSTDNSVLLIEKNIFKFSKKFCDVKILLIKNKKNKGVVYCDNIGAKKATSTFIYFASVDDAINPEFIKKSMESLNKYPKAVFSSCVVKVLSPNGQSVNFPLKYPKKEVSYIDPNECKQILFLRDFWTAGNSSIYKRQIYLDLGGLNKQFQSCSDIFLSMVVVAKYGGVFIPEQLTTFYLSEESYSGQLYAPNNIKKLEKIYQEMAHTFLQDYPDLFSVNFVNSWKERHELRLKLISYKKMLDSQSIIFRSDHSKIFSIFNVIIKMINYILFFLIFLILYFTRKRNIKDMILTMFLIKFRQKFSLVKS